MSSRTDAQQLEHLFEYHAFAVLQFLLFSELKFVDAIKCRWRHGAGRLFTSAKLSASNADSTLRIVKEQQPTKKSRLANHNAIPDAVVCHPCEVIGGG